MNHDSAALIAAARAALDEGDPRRAGEVLQRLRDRGGHSHTQWQTIAELSRRVRDPVGAEFALARALDLAPEDPGIRLAFATLLRAVGRHVEALDHLEAARRIAPADPRVAHLMGLMHLDQGLVDHARDWLSRARDAGADWPDLHADLGLAAQASGDLSAAEACYRRALSRSPGHERALRGLARLAWLRRSPEEGIAILEPLASPQLGGGLLAELAGLMAAAGRSGEATAMLESYLPSIDDPEGRMEIGFRLGALYDAAGNHRAAMAEFARANRAKGAGFDPVRYQSLIDRLLAVFGPDRMTALPATDHGDDRPVFIVGMPRSGTSLVEQILASHGDVHGAGEMADLGMLALSTARGSMEYPESVAGLGTDDLERLATAYRRRLDTIAPGARRVTDKMWQNFEFLGFAAMLFPRSRVIHCTRDPMDTAVSCYFHHFFGSGVAFAYDLAHIGAYYRQYRRIMRHWQEVLSLPILDVSYERLVADPEQETRRMLDFLDLPWDPGCLSFHETDRVVGTASHEQVRQPLYRTSVGRHRAYREWLDPLVEALGDDA